MPALSGKPFAGGPANPVDDSELLLSVSERRAAEEERREEQARLARPDSPCPADTPAQEAAMDALAEQRARERRVLPEPVEGEPDHPWRPRAPDADSESR